MSTAYAFLSDYVVQGHESPSHAAIGTSFDAKRFIPMEAWPPTQRNLSEDTSSYRTVDSSFEKTWETLDSFLNLPENWDSYGAETIRPDSIKAAKFLISDVDREMFSRSDQARPSVIAPLPDGRIQLEWKGVDREIEVEVSPDSRLDFLLVRLGDEPKYEEFDDADWMSVVSLIASIRGK